MRCCVDVRAGAGEEGRRAREKGSCAGWMHTLYVWADEWRGCSSGGSAWWEGRGEVRGSRVKGREEREAEHHHHHLPHLHHTHTVWRRGEKGVVDGVKRLQMPSLYVALTALRHTQDAHTVAHSNIYIPWSGGDRG